MPKVSVIVPIYNVEKYLRECLDSIVNQTLKDIEIILVDDGSTDFCPSICDEYAQRDKRLKVIHKTNEGLGKAYNVGIDNATGEYIGFVESDDFAELNMFEDLYNIAKNNDADVVKSDWFKYFTKSAKNERFYSNSKFIHNKVINIENSGDILTIPASVWSAIYKNTFLKENEIRYLETAGASYQDISFAFKTTALANRFVLTPNSYIHYRQDNEFSSVKSKGKVFAICREFEEIDSFLQDNPKIQKYVEEYKWINQYNVYMWNLERISEEYHREFIDKYSNEFLNAYEKGILDKIFFQKVSKKIFNLVIKDKEKFYEYFIKKQKNKAFKDKRSKIIALKISNKQIYLRLFGKDYIRWEKK